jgi:transposase
VWQCPPVAVDTPRHSVKRKRTNRFWSPEEKRSICLQTTAPGVSVAQVARRYAMNANLIHKWLKAPRFAPDSVEAPEPVTDLVFHPVEVQPAAPVPPMAPINDSDECTLMTLIGLTSRCRMGAGSLWRDVKDCRRS